MDRWYGADRKAIFPGKRVILTIPGDGPHGTWGVALRTPMPPPRATRWAS